MTISPDKKGGAAHQLANNGSIQGAGSLANKQRSSKFANNNGSAV
jgi:hypothetical protein